VSRPAPRPTGRTEWLTDRALRAYAVVAYVFLFLPILIVVVFSFNAGRHAAELIGLSTRWYEAAWSNVFVMKALGNSLTIAASTAVLATLLGTSSALAMSAMHGPARRVFEQVTYVAIIVPGIVIGIAALLFLVTAFGWLNPWLAYLMGGDAPRLGLGAHSVIATHTVFTLAIVNVIVRTRLRGMDRSLIEASGDLYATPWRTFRQITFPQILPAIVAGALLAFTFSFDDFIVAFFTAGQDQTLPIYLFASIRRGVTPEANAIATVLLAITIGSMVVAGLLYRRGRRRFRTTELVAAEAAPPTDAAPPDPVAPADAAVPAKP
jgi:spermidine/putrescine transport system permease protein